MDTNEIWIGSDLLSLSQKYGTPIYVINIEVLKRTYLEYIRKLNNFDIDAKIFFSVKTNPIPEIVKTLIELGSGVEIISEFEFWLVNKMGVEHDKIIVNGAIKSEKLLRSAVENRAGIINVESYEELQLIKNIATESGTQVNIGLRINPGLRKNAFDFTIFSGVKTSYFGFIVGSDEWKSALEFIKKNNCLKLRGLHFHIGSGIKSIKPYIRSIERALNVWMELLKQGFEVEILDIGGGFGIATSKEINLLDAIKLFSFGKSPKPPDKLKRKNLLEEVIPIFKEQVTKFASENRLPKPKIHLEPGRALCGQSQVLLLTVERIIQRKKSIPVAICDGGALSLSHALLAEYHDIYVLNKHTATPTSEYNLVGNLPTSLDIISLKRKLPHLEKGDIIVIKDVGAYFTALGNNFAGPRPAIVTIENNIDKVIMNRESFDNMISDRG